MAITIAILSQKGGTGKTTLTRSLAAGLTASGLNVLAVDADPQGNLSEYFGVPADALPTLGEVLAGQNTAMDAVHNGVIPANLGLAEAELMLAGKMCIRDRSYICVPGRGVRFVIWMVSMPNCTACSAVSATVSSVS